MIHPCGVERHEAATVGRADFHIRKAVQRALEDQVSELLPPPQYGLCVAATAIEAAGRLSHTNAWQPGSSSCPKRYRIPGVFTRIL